MASAPSYVSCLSFVGCPRLVVDPVPSLGFDWLVPLTPCPSNTMHASASLSLVPVFLSPICWWLFCCGYGYGFGFGDDLGDDLGYMGHGCGQVDVDSDLEAKTVEVVGNAGPFEVRSIDRCC